MKPTSDMKIFVLLKYGLDAKKYHQLFLRGKVPGSTPYDYHYAESFDCQVLFSVDHPENTLTKIFRKIIFKILGGDLIHTWRNRKKLWQVDAIWTFTEREWLAVSFLRLFRPGSRQPIILGRTVWLTDSGNKWSLLRRKIYQIFFPLPDVILVSSPVEKKVLHKIFPQARLHCMKFGISLISFPLKNYQPRLAKTDTTKVVSLGNDPNRDWKTLIQAMGDQADIELTIATRHNISQKVSPFSNIKLTTFTTMYEHLALYDWADLIVVTLLPCQRISGITVILEAIARGVPVICTKTGGLEFYFHRDEIYFIPPQDTQSLKSAIRTLIGTQSKMQDMSCRSQETIMKDGLDSKSWIERHCQLTRKLL